MLVLNFAHLFCRNKFDRSLLEYRHESNASLYSTYSTYGYHLNLNCIKCQSKDLFQYLKTLTPFKHASAWKGEQTKEQKRIFKTSAPKDHAKTFQPLCIFANHNFKRFPYTYGTFFVCYWHTSLHRKLTFKKMMWHAALYCERL